MYNDLPLDITDRIFTSFTDFESLWTAIRVSKHSYSVFKLRSTSILYAVSVNIAGRNVIHVLRLVRTATNLASSDSEGVDAIPAWKDVPRYPVTTEQRRLLIKYADVLQGWESFLSRRHKDCTVSAVTLTDAESDRFQQAMCEFWMYQQCFGEIWREDILDDTPMDIELQIMFLKRLSTEELQRFASVCLFMKDTCIWLCRAFGWNNDIGYRVVAALTHPTPYPTSVHLSVIMDELLSTLNGPQRKSVEHPPNVPLQILAGPGSGKTKVLTTRIAYLILRHAIAPSTICAVTFTNKAANEMKLRLTKLIGKEKVMRLKMGTFHALCARFLRQHAALVGLEGNFTICDAEESKKLVGKILKTYKDYIIAHKIMFDDSKEIVSKISKAKTKGYEPDDMVAILLDDLKGKTIPHKNLATLKDLDPAGWIFVEVYREYERTLRATNSLDFDDLLIWGVKLFGKHKQAAAWCKHVLVDEFQDTNTVQYDLMRYIADANRCVTIVGDPDQSIYGWRSADIGNLKNMQRDFPSTKQIFLEQNYRSTASILALSLGIISGDNVRIKKTLHTAHPSGPRPMMHRFLDEKMEAQFIGTEMKRVVAATGGILDWNDFAILLRFSALSREIEASLQREGIPYRMLGGHKFFERLEVKDILAYLQLVDNPQFLPAFMRTINLPPRNIGEKSIAQVIQRAEQAGLSPMALVERIHDGKVPDIKPPLKRKVGPFVTTLRTLREQANSGTSPAMLIRKLLELIKYTDHLKKSHEDWETRLENIVELINFASQEKETALDAPPTEAAKVPVRDHRATQLEDEGLVIIEDDSRNAMSQSTDADDNADNETPLRQFLQASMLSTDSQTKDDDNKDKVTISTCHAAKGLEWPVVMVPAVENKVFPHKRSDDHAEER
ncbi:hypothetical protein EWM64_g1894 [Hericium alpestre]|uniref:DNA 3'-5' helicase n=1 Tax=Hericium alpestre TaxID=135208 RepID=A0A4Z0A955_9AGAM|nr:hypothetical protein EWM64_g1894 [Hericium alpestre]